MVCQIPRFMFQACFLFSFSAAIALRPAGQAQADIDMQVLNAERRALASQQPRGSSGGSKGKYAFVMLAFDPPGAKGDTLWNVLPMAHAIRELSDYPLLLLTNTTHFPGGEDVNASFSRLGVHVLPVRDVPVPDSILHEYRTMPCQEKNPPVCAFQFLKLQIWRLTQFDKLIWMDSDSILYRSVDDLFEKSGTWAQQDNWHCGSFVSDSLSYFANRLSAVAGFAATRTVDWIERHLPGEAKEKQSDDVCSGFLVLEPSEATYRNMVNYMGSQDSVPGGDQQVIADYFANVRKTPVSLLNVSTASFGQCMGRAIPGNVLPAFAHKSEWSNSCFQLGASQETCQQVPLGQYWHNRFCKAAQVAQITQEARINSFCSQ